MKKNTIQAVGALALAALFASCQGSAGNSTAFNLKGTINGFEGEMIKIGYMLNDSQITDSTTITDGQFAFKGDLQNEAVVNGFLCIGDIDYMNRNISSLLLEPKDMTIAIDTANFQKAVIAGSLSQAESDTLNNRQEAVYNEIGAIRQEMQACTDEAKMKELEAKLEEWIDKARRNSLDFIRSHPDSYVSPIQLMGLMSDMEYTEIKEIFDGLAPAVQQSSHAKDIVTELNALESIQPGKPAPYFRALSVKGDSISITDLKGKVVLLDFWASWCVPCRKSFPHIKSLYEKYNDKGFEVFCVGDNDSSPDKWREAIEKDGIQNFHHVLRGLVWDQSKGLAGMDRSKDISDKYAIHYLPTKYLIDREGNMIGKMDTDEELDAKLKEIFGF